MLARAVPFVILLLFGCLPAAAQEGLSGAEVNLLLELGVPSSRVLQTLEARGGPRSVTDAEMLRAGSLGAGSGLLDALAGALRSRRWRQRVAREFVVQAIPGTTWRILVPEQPEPWSLEGVPAGTSALAVMRPPDHEGRDWLGAPGIFCLIQRDTPFVPGSEDYLARRLTLLLQRRLLRWRDPDASIESVPGRVGRRVVSERRLFVHDRGRRFKGVLALRTRILRNGTVLVLGFACGESERERVSALFDTVAASFDVPGEDVPARAPAVPTGR